MKLKSTLRALDVDELRGIQEFWQLPEGPADDAADKETWVDHLYPRLQSSAAFRRGMDRLEEEERDLLTFLAIHGGSMEEKELRKRSFPGDRSGMLELVQGLAKRGFLWIDRWKDVEGKPRLFGIPEPFLRFIELPHFWSDYLGNQLR